jgi:hypothetical protein
MSVGQAQCPYHASQLSTELNMSVGPAQCPYHATPLSIEINMSVGQAQCPYHASQLSIELSMSVGQAQCPYHATQPKISSPTSPRLLTFFCQTNHTSKLSNMKFQSSLYKHMKVLINQHGIQVNLGKHILWLSYLGFIA